MNPRWVQRCATLAVYVCVGTVLTQLIAVAALWGSGKLTRDKLVQMLAVLHDVSWRDAPSHSGHAATLVGLSYEQVEQLRGLKLLDLEHKENALRHHHQQFWNQHQQQRRMHQAQQTVHELLSRKLAELRGELEASDESDGQLR